VNGEDVIFIPIKNDSGNVDVESVLDGFFLAEKKKKQLASTGSIFANGRVASLKTRLDGGETIVIMPEIFDKLDYQVWDRPINVLYEDEWTYVLDKPSGIIIHPDKKDKTGTLANLAANYLAMHGLNRCVRYLHRLDKDTTGCVLFATNFLAHSYLDYIWNTAAVRKEYLALVEGHLAGKAGRIELPIGNDRHRNNHYIVYSNGKPAITDYEVIKEYPGYSLLRISIETGRTHQIRVHMGHIGHPVLGDLAYGARHFACDRVQLHASSITYPHPLTHEKIIVTSPLPEDFRQYAY